MKNMILLIGPSELYKYYKQFLDEQPGMRAVWVKNLTEAVEISATMKIKFAAIVTNLFDHHGPELGTQDTDNYCFTGAAIAKRLREKYPNAMFVLTGAANTVDAEMEKYAGKLSDIVRLPPQHALPPSLLAQHLIKLTPCTD